jgi:hypothetical protein
LLLTPALAAKQNAAVRIRIMLNPFDPAAACEELINGLFAWCRSGLVRQSGLRLIIGLYALPFVLVARIGQKRDLDLRGLVEAFLQAIDRSVTSPTSAEPRAPQMRYPRPFPTHTSFTKRWHANFWTRRVMRL